MKILGSRLYVTRLDAPKAASSLIEVVEFNPEQSQYAVVLSVGNGERLKDGTRRPIEISVGDTVIIGKYSGAPLTVKMGENDVEGFIVQEEDVLAVVEL